MPGVSNTTAIVTISNRAPERPAYRRGGRFYLIAGRDISKSGTYALWATSGMLFA